MKITEYKEPFYENLMRSITENFKEIDKYPLFKYIENSFVVREETLLLKIKKYYKGFIIENKLEGVFKEEIENLCERIISFISEFIYIRRNNETRKNSKIR